MQFLKVFRYIHIYLNLVQLRHGAPDCQARRRLQRRRDRDSGDDTRWAGAGTGEQRASARLRVMAWCIRLLRARPACVLW